MLVYTIKTTNQNQLLGLTHVLGINTKINSLAVFNEIFSHHRRNDGELVGEVNIAGFHLVDIDEF